MVEANIKIIEELKYFLETVSTDAEFRELVANDKHDFTRNRKLPLERVVAIIINMPKRSLSAEIHDFFECLGASKALCTKGALSLQRGKLNPLFFEAWNKWLVSNFYHYYGDHVNRWKGFLLQAVDGSTAYLFNKKEVMDHFGCHTNQHQGGTPMARVMQIHDVLNDITVWGGIYPFKKSEQAIMAEHIPNLTKDSLTLFDRGFPGYGLMYMMLNEEERRHFLMRCKVDLNKQTKEFARNKKKSVIIELTPSYKSIAMLRKHGYIVTNKTTIKVRMVKFMLSSGEMEILITDLYDEQQYSVEDLKYLYGLRWGIETSYGKQKNQLQMEQFSGHRVVCIKQDYSATIFVANLQSLIEKQCDGYIKSINSRRKLTYRINRNLSWASLKHNIVKLFLFTEPEEILRHLQHRFEQHLEPVRPNRHPPRNRKSKKLLGKYQTFTNYRRTI
jgi:hypothetical protein